MCYCYKETQNTETALWPDRQEFLGYHMTMKAMSRDEAIAQWAKDSADPAIEKRGSGNGLRIKVMGIPTSNTLTGKRVEGRVDASHGIENKDELDNANKRLCLGVMKEDYELVFGKSGRTGNASSSGPLSIASSSWTLREEDDTNNVSIEFLKHSKLGQQDMAAIDDYESMDMTSTPVQPDGSRRTAQHVGQTI